MDRHIGYYDAKRNGTDEKVSKIWLSQIVQQQKDNEDDALNMGELALVLGMWRKGYIALTIETLD